eukprot:15444722-Alexandrium_andersonii.AAC.1
MLTGMTGSRGDLVAFGELKSCRALTRQLPPSTMRALDISTSTSPNNTNKNTSEFGTTTPER